MKNYDRIMDLLLGLVAMLIIMIVLCISGTIESHYSMKGEVVEIHNDIVTIEDTAGHLWDVYRDSTHYTELTTGQKVKVRYFTNFTNRRKDDVVLNVKVIN